MKNGFLFFREGALDGEGSSVTASGRSFAGMFALEAIYLELGDFLKFLGKIWPWRSTIGRLRSLSQP